MDEIIRQAIERVARGLLIKTVLVGKAVNVTDTQCDVEIEGAPTKTDVVLNAIEGTLDSFVTVVPKEASTVLIGVIENRKTDAFVICCSEVEKVIMKCGDAEYEFRDGLVASKVNDTVHKMTGSAHEIKTKDESLKKLLEDLLDELLMLTVTTSAGPSGTPINSPQLTNIKNRIPKLLS